MFNCLQLLIEHFGYAYMLELQACTSWRMVEQIIKIVVFSRKRFIAFSAVNVELFMGRSINQAIR